MSTNIELRSLKETNTNESDTEYHEIKNEDLIETTFSSETQVKQPKAYDFFTQFDVKAKKETRKKKKDKAVKDSSTLMDFITSELASSQGHLVNNVVTKVEYSREQESYLEKTPRFQRVFQRNKAWRGDAEQGWRNKPPDLSPVFPRVLENTLTKDQIIPVQYVEPVMFHDIITDYQEHDLKQSPKFLDIAINDITFVHHQDFSLEKLICVKLIEYYKDYCNTQKAIKDTLKNIDINRKTRDNVKEQLLKISSTKKEDLRFDQTILKYTGKFLQLKDKYYQLLNAEKDLQHKVMSLWADIKTIRQKSGCVDTVYEIEVTKVSLSDDAYEKEYMQIFEIEYSDKLEKIEYEYVNSYLEYKELKNNYEAGDSDRKKIPKPKLQIDQNKLKEEVEEIVNRIVRKEKINVVLKQRNKTVVKKSNEKQKSTYSYNFKIYVDNVFVCESETFTSQLNFNRVDFIDILSIQILANNETLVIFLCEDDIKVASIDINLKRIRTNSSFAKFSSEKFIYTNTIEPSSKYVGSGVEIKEIAAINKVRLKSSGLFKGALFSTAEVNIKIGWSEKLNQNQSESINDSMYLGRQLKRLLHGVDKPNVGILTDIIEKLYEKQIDDDTNLINALQEACKATINDNNTFTIDESSPELVRLKLLHLRNCGGFEDVENKAIPIFASQISTEQLNCLQKSEEKEFDANYFDSGMDPIDIQRFMSTKYIEKLNTKMQKNLKEHLMKKTYKGVVRDFKDLSLRGIFSNQSNLDLETTSSLAKQQMLSECVAKEQDINITVFKASNLLDRSTAIISAEGEDDESIAGFKVRPLRPFVRVSYHGVSAQTPTTIGCHPSWNHTVKIKTKLSPISSIHVDVYDECKVDVSEAYSDEEPSSLSRAVHYRFYNKWLGTLRISLYTVLSLGSLRGTFKLTAPPLLIGYDTSESKDSKSNIPEFIQLMKKETSFLSLHISTNLFHLGGFQGYTQPVPNSEDDVIIRHLNTFVTEYINEFPSRNISLTFIDSFGRNKCVTEFLQPIPLPDPECFPKHPKRIESAMSKSSGLSKSSSSKSSKRKLSIATIDDKESEYSGPDIWKGTEMRGDHTSKLVDAAARYVALIPTYEVTESHVVTLSGTELLKVLYGSPLDHTILLASYFLHLGIRCWMVTGLALPRGLSSFVLVRYDQRHRVVMSSEPERSRGFMSRRDSKQFTWFVYDAVSGERFELRDAGCPLKTVSYVFDAENIWVNIQSSQDCESVCFDFTKSSNWQVVFEGPLLVMKQPPATDSGLYSAAPDVEQLRSALESKLKAKVQKWRPLMKTIWNRYCSGLLREMLPHWEYWAFHPLDPRPVPGQRLKQLMVTYKMFGFPLNMSYTNAKSVTSTVKSTGIHLNDDPDVEFALAVEVYSYPNNVLSVWVFLASITRI